MLLNKLFERRSNPEENPKNPLAPIDGWASFNGLSAGPAVSPKEGLAIPTVYACINVISSSIAQLPITVFKKGREGGLTEQPRHPAAKLLTIEPSQYQTPALFFEMMMAHVLGWGSGYAYIERNNAGQPTELIPLMPWATCTKFDSNPNTGKPRQYYQTQIDGVTFEFDSDQILHIRGLGWDLGDPKSPIALHAETMGLQIAATRYGAKFFQNSARPSGALIVKGKLNPRGRQALLKSWAGAVGSDGSRLGTALLEGDIDFKPLTVNPDEAQFLQTRNYQRQDICAIYNVPPPMIQDTSRATFSNITEQSIMFVRNTLGPWILKIEQELNRKLFSITETGKFIARFDMAALMRGTPGERAAYYTALGNLGAITPNEIRAREELNPIEGGDRPIVALNMGTVGPGGQQPSKTEQGDQVKPNKKDPEPDQDNKQNE